MKEGPRVEIGRFSRRTIQSFVPDGLGVFFATVVVASPIAALLYTVTQNAHWALRVFAAVVQLICFVAIFQWAVYIVNSRRTRLWLVPRGIILRTWEDTQRGGHARTRHLRFADVGHLTVGRPNCLRVHVRLENPIRVDVSRFNLEDDADLFVEHFEKHAPEHLLSIDDSGDHRYSRQWSLDELLADDPAVTALDVRRVDELWFAFDIGEQTWIFDEPNGTLRRQGDGRSVLRVLRRRRILFDPGVVIAHVLRAKPHRIEYRIGTGDELNVQTRIGAADLNGAPIAKFQGDDLEPNIEFAKPVQPVVALLVAIAAVGRTGKLG